MGLLDGQTPLAYYEGSDYGNYQFTSLDDIISNFIVAYVGEAKIISKAKRNDVAFHAQRALQELSFDVFKSCKAQEIVVPATLQMILPQDYINYTKVSWVDDAGIKHLLYPTNKTNNPTNIYQNSDGDFRLTVTATVQAGGSIYLDAEHNNIKNGMTVRGLENLNNGVAIPGIVTVRYAQVSGGNNELYLWNGAAIIDFIADLGFVSGDIITLHIDNADGSLVLEEELSRQIDECTIAIGEFKITTPTGTDTDNIEIGMTVSGFGVPNGTLVVGIVDTVIYINKALTETQTSGPGITFLSPKSISDTWGNYKSSTSAENNNDNYEDDTYWSWQGERYGLDPQHAQVNGSYYIDCVSGKIHFSSNMNGKTVILDYLSDSLGTDGEMQVHKFAEEAMYKWIIYAIISTRINTSENIVRRFKKEKTAAIRQAKLRLSNIKIEEIAQVMRGKSKQIKH